MNPPSAIQNAMGRERKPFTYLPGGLDLSQIKSERMAQRLMRNAMNQGVEAPVQPIVSPTTPTTPILVPNFNCLPVQVFPSFSLPANPKSLLRTRSAPQQTKEAAFERVSQKPQLQENFEGNQDKIPSSSIINNGFTPTINNNITSNKSIFNQNNENTYFNPSVYGVKEPQKEAENDLFHNEDCSNLHLASSENFIYNNNNTLVQNNEAPDTIRNNIDENFSIKPLSEKDFADGYKAFDNIIENVLEEDSQKVVKKQVKKEKVTEEDESAEADVTVKLTPKKAAAKTETTVEVVSKTLSDGSTEEVKTTKTTTTINGKTEIATKVETTIIPPEHESEEEVEEEEEYEEISDTEEVHVQKQSTQDEDANKVEKSSENENVKEIEEKSEVTVTKKVVILEEPQNIEADEEEEVEEEEVVDEVEEQQVEDDKIENDQEVTEVVTISKQKPAEATAEVKLTETENVEEDEEEEEEVEEEVVVKETQVSTEKTVKEDDQPEEKEEESEVEAPTNKTNTNAEDEETVVKEEEKSEVVETQSEQKEQEIKKESEPTDSPVEVTIKVTPKVEVKAEPPKSEVLPEKPRLPSQLQQEQVQQPKQRSPLLESVESIDIKPITTANESFTQSHSEKTETKSTLNDSLGRPYSVQQTESHRVENLVTVNKTMKTIDHAYEQITQHGLPTVKTYFAPTRERVSTSPQPSRPYQATQPQEEKSERRHSLLLERLSTERQIPADIYQSSYQTQSNQYESYNQWNQTQEPQSEVVIASNVKPSSINNQQWYNQSAKENVIYNNTKNNAMSTPIYQQQWSQPAYTEKVTQDYSKKENYQTNIPAYTPKPSTWGSTGINVDNNMQTSQSSYLKESTQQYQTTPQYTSGYVPPPWETDSNYTAPNNTQTFYQAPAPLNYSTAPNEVPGWQPPPPKLKFTKPTPTAYQPPAPNQSFVKSNISGQVEPPRIPGRKTYYSEYERRYISVPESTYVPNEAKYQPQPDPSPQYYYDNNEPVEKVEHTWRKELREFSEKSQTQTQEVISPPWEDNIITKTPTVKYTPTPSWSQTLRPNSNRERSFESEFVGNQDWKTNTIGRTRPVSSYENRNVGTEKPRSVSVDRYNPLSYHSPLMSEHPPVETHLLSPTPKVYHNPNVPSYHTRAPTEIEHNINYPKPRSFESRASPLQSRSFKYLQWITGTDE